jgi:hypothetical protein
MCPGPLGLINRPRDLFLNPATDASIDPRSPTVTPAEELIEKSNAISGGLNPNGAVPPAVLQSMDAVALARNRVARTRLSSAQVPAATGAPSGRAFFGGARVRPASPAFDARPPKTPVEKQWALPGPSTLKVPVAIPLKLDAFGQPVPAATYVSMERVPDVVEDRQHRFQAAPERPSGLFDTH